MTKILLIEDDPNVRANILDLLEAEDYDVVGAENGLLGAIWAQENLPDLIISDVMMPEIDGHEVLSALQADPATASIPFIFLTALADKADLRKGMELGADDYLTKPFTREELLGAISTRLAKQAALEDKFNIEQKRSEAVQHIMEELQQIIETKDSVLQQCQQELYQAIPKLNLAITLLENSPPGSQRDRCLAILQQACAAEIGLLKDLPQAEELLSVNNTALLEQA